LLRAGAVIAKFAAIVLQPNIEYDFDQNCSTSFYAFGRP